MDFGNRARQARRRLGHRDDVHVVRHQAVGPDLNRPPAAPLGHKTDVELVARVAEEDRLTPIAALSHVVPPRPVNK